MGMQGVCNEGAPKIYMVSTGRLVVRGKGQGKRQDLLLQWRVMIDLVLDIVCDLVETAHVCLDLNPLLEGTSFNMFVRDIFSIGVLVMIASFKE